MHTESSTKGSSKSKKKKAQRKRKSSRTSQTSKASKKSKPVKAHLVKVEKLEGKQHPKKHLKQHPEASQQEVAETEDAAESCFSYAYLVQIAIQILNIIGILAYYFMNNASILDAFVHLYCAQMEFNIVVIFGKCVLYCRWFSVFNCILLSLGELGYALYVTVIDLQDECQEVGCTSLQGDILHRIIFVSTLLIFGIIHGIMAASILAALCVTPTKTKSIKVESIQKVESVQSLRKRRQSVSTSRSLSLSRSVSSKRSSSANPRHITKKVPIDYESTSSWSRLPSSKFSSTSPSNSSQKLSLISSCPYSASSVANSQAINQQPLQQQQQQSNPYSSYPRSDTVAVTFPSATSVNAPECQSVTVRMPFYGYPPVYYPQQPQVTYYPSHESSGAATQNQHVLVSFPSSVIAPPRMQ
uniref:Uncharacterized protein n=1 Tax=Panagrolaimus superbus TaxID=310955 RepID=A0A914XWX0_9BILA